MNSRFNDGSPRACISKFHKVACYETFRNIMLGFITPPPPPLASYGEGKELERLSLASLVKRSRVRPEHKTNIGCQDETRAEFSTTLLCVVQHFRLLRGASISRR
jgi:hypothetical protein